MLFLRLKKWRRYGLRIYPCKFFRDEIKVVKELGYNLKFDTK